MSPSTRPRHRKVSEVVAREILTAICEQRLAPGTSLPSEAQMLNEYGIARTTLREALRILEVHGVISIKTGPGGGPRVLELSPAAFGQMVSLYFQVAGATFGDLLRARTIFETMVVGEAAVQLSDAARADLEDFRSSAATDLDVEDAAYVESSSRFHELIVSISGNSVLDLIGRVIRQMYHDRMKATIFPDEARRGVLRQHIEIAQAILDGDAELAQRRMRGHMDDFSLYVAAENPGMMTELITWN